MMHKMPHRAMRPGDIRECVEIIAHHPVLGPRYGPHIELLFEALLRLLSYEAQVSIVHLRDESPDATVCLFGLAAFVRDDYLREIKNMPQFWVGPDLARRLTGGKSPILSASEMREANSGGGLNLLVWEGCARQGYENNGELQRQMMDEFIEQYQGYFLNEAIAAQCESADRLGFTLKTGGALWDPVAGSYATRAEFTEKELSEIASHPHIVGLTRQMEMDRQSGWGASWVGALFDYHPPKLGLSRSEQRLLLSALPGPTDLHLAATLGVSLPTVKKLWASIYLRVDEFLPELVGNREQSGTLTDRRGKEKRRRVLEYVRNHREELRPASRKLLARQLTNSTSGWRARKSL